MTQQLCWICAKACGGCSWTEIDYSTGKARFEPISGWDATYNAVSGSYSIKSCPEYEAEHYTPERTAKEGGPRLKYDIEKFRDFMMAGMTDNEISRRMGGMPASTIRTYKERIWRGL